MKNTENLNSQIEDTKKSIPYLFLLWMMISSLYYIETLFSGSFQLNIEESFLSKITKYILCLIFSLYFIFRAKAAIAAIFLFFIIIIEVIHLSLNGSINLFATNLIIILSMFGLSSVLHMHPHATPALAKTIVISGTVVGVFSIIELTYLRENFISYWTATGGVRSISTLFNPNNLGIYIGASLLAMPWANFSRKTNIIFLIPLLFSFAASGSRTAWVAFLLCFLIIVFSKNNIFNARKPAYYFLLLLMISMIIIYYFSSSDIFNHIESENRGFDFLTLLIRFVNATEYINNLDSNILFPDFYDARTSLIQDNVYLILINTFGILLSICFLTYFIINKQKNKKIPKQDFLLWKYILIYYVISGLSNSFINSFPNNQLFFVALGGVYIFSPKNTSKSTKNL